MIKSRKQSLIVIGAFVLVMLLGTVTYAFFNYTRTGVSNTIKVGRISFVTRQDGNINLTNVFPISSSEATGENPNYDEVAIEIVGDTDYTGGIEYVVTATNVNMVVAGKQIPLTLEVSVDGKDGKTLGTLETGDYYTNRDNYTVSKYKIEYDGELEEGDHIIVGYIAPNTTSGTAEGIGGVINIKAYIDASKVLVTDTYDGTGSGINGTPNSLAEGKTIFTTTEWNSMKENPRSFKIKVEANEGIWVDEPLTFREVIARKSPTVDYIRSYNDFVASNSSYSTYTTQDTIGVNNNKQEVYYYTSNKASANSNVLFAGYCWQIVRTTDNGGVRLIYNGVAKKGGIALSTEKLSSSDIIYTNDATYPYSYNSTTKKWTSTNNIPRYSKGTFIFKVKEAGDYALSYIFSQDYYDDYINVYKNNTLIIRDNETNEDVINFDSLLTTDEIKVEIVILTGNSSNTSNIEFEIDKITNGVESENPICKPNRTATKGISGTNVNTLYLTDIYGFVPATVFGRSYDYDIETGLFTLEDTDGLPSTWNDGDTNNNGITDYDDLLGTYTCKSSATTCSELYYVSQRYDSSRAYLIKYTIANISNYRVMGVTPYNVYDNRVIKVGYMFSVPYKTNVNYASRNEFFSTITWDSTNSRYILSNSNNSSTPSSTYRYVYGCSDYSNSQTCPSIDYTKVQYYLSENVFILLENGETMDDILYRMIGYGSSEIKERNKDYNINTINSAFKGYVDNWYKKNLIEYSNYIDNNAIYCNDRSIKDLGNWSSFNGGNTSIHFNQYDYPNTDLNCVNVTDRFAVTNNKAKLTYPIGVLTEPERGLMGESYAKAANAEYWTMTAHSDSAAKVRVVGAGGNESNSNVTNDKGVRGVITLKPTVKLESGTGTYTDPYIVGPIVQRDN